MSQHIVAIKGSYRKNGIIHQAVNAALEEARAHGATVEDIDLLEKEIGFCTNCRTCMQAEPEQPRGACVLKDDLEGILQAIDRADLLILASPINMYSVTALMKRFMERLGGYGYWPWGSPSPKGRKREKKKKVLVLTSSAAPGPIVRIAGRFWSRPLLMVAKTILGVKPRSLHLGMVAQTRRKRLPEKKMQKVRRTVRRLLD